MNFAGGTHYVCKAYRFSSDVRPNIDYRIASGCDGEAERDVPPIIKSVNAELLKVVIASHTFQDGPGLRARYATVIVGTAVVARIYRLSHLL